MSEPLPWVYHFTHVTNLPSVIEHGLLSDTLASNLLETEIGNRTIKAQRARRAVPIPPGGVVADYVPFYYATRSPMMYAIHRGNVETYTDGCDRLVYLRVSLDRLLAWHPAVVGTDRNAVLATASFVSGFTAMLKAVDWPLMKARQWANTHEDPDRRERRQAECLAHRHVPWELVGGIGVKTEPVAAEVRASLARLGRTGIDVLVRPDLYF